METSPFLSRFSKYTMEFRCNNIYSGASVFSRMTEFGSLSDAIREANFFADSNQSFRDIQDKCMGMLKDSRLSEAQKRHGMDDNEIVPIIIYALIEEACIFSRINEGLCGHSTSCLYEIRLFVLYLLRGLYKLPKVNISKTPLYLPVNPSAVKSITFNEMCFSGFIVASRDYDHAKALAAANQWLLFVITGSCACYDIGDFVSSGEKLAVIIPEVSVKFVKQPNEVDGVVQIHVVINQCEQICSCIFQKFLDYVDSHTLIISPPPPPPSPSQIRCTWLSKLVEGIIQPNTPLSASSSEIFMEQMAKAPICNPEDTLIRLSRRFASMACEYKAKLAKCYRSSEAKHKQMIFLFEAFLSLSKMVYSKMDRTYNKIILFIELDHDIEGITECPMWIEKVKQQIAVRCSCRCSGVGSTMCLCSKRSITFVVPKCHHKIMEVLKKEPNIVPGCCIKAGYYSPVPVVSSFPLPGAANIQSPFSPCKKIGDENDLCSALKAYLSSNGIYHVSVVLVSSSSSSPGEKKFIITLASPFYIDQLKKLCPNVSLCPEVEVPNKVDLNKLLEELKLF